VNDDAVLPAGPPGTSGDQDRPPAIVVVGAASRDVAADDPRGWRLGGGVTYAALLLGRLGLRAAALIGVDAEAAGAHELDRLRGAGVRVALAPLASGPVFENIERPAGRVQRSLAASDPVLTSALPAAWRAAPAWLLNPVADELPPDWADIPDGAALVGVGWQGLLRALVPGDWVRRVPPGPSAIIRRADVVGIGADDIAGDMGVDELVALLRPGATLLFTRGATGGIAVEAGADRRPLRRRSWPSIPPARFVDPTGAGDVFLAAAFAARAEPRLVGGRMSGGWDLRLGAAAGSLVCEERGLDGVPDRTSVTRRMGEVRRSS
jgi:1D-myo-inositol 3-kinase